MASEVIEQLKLSDDPLERELAEALLRYQEDKASLGLSRSLGYEPRDIRQKGAVAVIEARVKNGASGFEEVDKHYSYEAIVDRHPDRFREDVVAAARKRLRGPESADTEITSSDVRLIASSRSKKKYAELSEEEHKAYVRVSNARQSLGDHLKSKLADPNKFEVRTTSGFNVNSGVRSYIPKDLWFSVSPKENARDLAGMPQLFMIVSERGIEYGYGASVSPSDFSQQSVKEIVRAAAPMVFERLPLPDSEEAEQIAQALEENGTWFFRRKHRLPPKQREFRSLQAWLGYLKSPDGKKHAAGTVSRYLLPEEVDEAQLIQEMSAMADLFAPLIDRDWHSDATQKALEQTTTQDVPPQRELDLEKSNEFKARLSKFINLYGEKRSRAFGIDEELGSAIHGLQSWLEEVPAVADRPTIKVKISVGLEGWTKTPWIALLDDRVTTTTQHGTYIVFLIAEVK